MKLPLFILLVALFAGCAPGGTPANPAPQDRIVGLLQESALAWNRGDLDGFLLPYADGAATTFVGRSGVVRGKPAVRTRYAEVYFAAGAPSATLDFRDIEVRTLGSDHALAVGHYLLRSRDTGAPTAEGIFSLVFARTGEGWRIIHDHSS